MDLWARGQVNFFEDQYFFLQITDTTNLLV